MWTRAIWKNPALWAVGGAACQPMESSPRWDAWEDREIVLEREGLRVEGTSVHLVGWGRENAWREPFRAVPSSTSERVEWDRDGLVEWWRPATNGLEQGWDLEHRPADAGSLRLSLATNGRWEDGIRLVGNDEVYSYSGLRSIHSANGDRQVHPFE